MFPRKPILQFWSKFTIYKSFGNRSNRWKRMLESIGVSVGCPIWSLIYPFVPRSALFCSVACLSSIFVLSAPKCWSGSGFVRQSMMFTLVLMFRTSSFFFVMSSRIWWNYMSMCFVFAWYTGFLMRQIALCESQYRVSVGWSIWLLAEKSTDSRCNQIASLAASEAAMHSLSVVESVVHSLASTSIGEDISWCWFLIIKVVGIIRIREAFDFGRLVRFKS